mmetsp:Transcript_7855/g.24260  ORF Transcript_7855/g.24260 Transcript_7855/m.24260 type:complete len:326 (+) Transcript_7855:60-1037(+)
MQRLEFAAEAVGQLDGGEQCEQVQEAFGVCGAEAKRTAIHHQQERLCEGGHTGLGTLSPHAEHCHALEAGEGGLPARRGKVQLRGVGDDHLGGVLHRGSAHLGALVLAERLAERQPAWPAARREDAHRAERASERAQHLGHPAHRQHHALVPLLLRAIAAVMHQHRVVRSRSRSRRACVLCVLGCLLLLSLLLLERELLYGGAGSDRTGHHLVENREEDVFGERLPGAALENGAVLSQRCEEPIQGAVAHLGTIVHTDALQTPEHAEQETVGGLLSPLLSGHGARRPRKLARERSIGQWQMHLLSERRRSRRSGLWIVRLVVLWR